MGQALSGEPAAPIIDVGYEELTYRMLQEEMNSEKLTFTPNRPQSFVQRFFMDLFGGLLLYGGTFIVCDLLRAACTGEWTRLEWMFLGPWNYITGSPLLHRLTRVFDSHSNPDRALDRCEREYNIAQAKCDSEYFLDGFANGGQCRAAAQQQYQQCYTSSPECAACEQSYLTENNWGGTQCFDDPYVPGGQYCMSMPPPPSQQEAELHCLGELGYDP